MKVKPIQQAQQRNFDFYKLFMDNYSFQIEATTCIDEPDNKVNIIFPSGIPHYQISDESWKDKLIYEIRQHEENNSYCFFEVVSKKEYGQYLEEESSGVFNPLCDDYKIYIFFFYNHVVEIVSYEEPIFVYSYTYEYNKD